MSSALATEKSRRAVIYARVSTDKREQATSIPNQVASCRKYCKDQGWDVVAEFTDTASGSSFNRPGWKKLLALVESGKVGRIVITTLDRISRNTLDYGLLKRDILEILEVTINPIMGMASQLHQDDGLSDPSSELAEDMEMVIAQHTRRLIRWKTIQGMRRRGEQGIYLGKPPFGTMKGPEKGIPLHDPSTWPFVEQIFKMSAAGYTYSEICEHLNKSGIPSHKGAKWDHSSVRLILSNYFYLGECFIKGQVYELRHQCRIVPDLWERAQKPKTAKKAVGRKPADYMYLLPHVVASSYTVSSPKDQAGQPLELRPRYTYGRFHAKHHYYYRSDRLRKHGGIEAECDGDDFLRSSIRAEDLDEAVVKELISLCHESRSGLLVKHSLNAAEQADKALAREQAGIVRELAKLERQLISAQRKMVRAFDGEFTELIRAMNDDVAQLRLQTDVMKARLDEIDETRSRFSKVSAEIDESLGLVSLIEKLWKDQDYFGLRRAIRVLVKEVDIRPDGAYMVMRPLVVLRNAGYDNGGESSPNGNHGSSHKHAASKKDVSKSKLASANSPA